jgi:hypothetical protein
MMVAMLEILSPRYKVPGVDRGLAAVAARAFVHGRAPSPAMATTTRCDGACGADEDGAMSNDCDII